MFISHQDADLGEQKNMYTIFPCVIQICISQIQHMDVYFLNMSEVRPITDTVQSYKTLFSFSVDY